MDATALARLTDEMRLANRSEITIRDRLDTLDRLARTLDHELLDATETELLEHQKAFKHLAPATVDIYTRHIQAFYRWAHLRGYIDSDPSLAMIRPTLRRGRPHPTSLDDLRIIFACTLGPLRLAYTLAAFAGLRRGEICRLHRSHLELDSNCPTAIIDGKGGKERIVPLLPPVVAEIHATGLAAGWLVTKNEKPYPLEALSVDSHFHLQGLGVSTTLHSMRHRFATTAYQTSHDVMLVRDLLGHESVATTEIYAEPATGGAHARLAGVSAVADDMLAPRRLFAVRPCATGA